MMHILVSRTESAMYDTTDSSMYGHNSCLTLYFHILEDTGGGIY